jgi:UDP-N-acetylmuramyl pentapeptide phosphotransferase/UDP-N-acetylglucosamine-1-phosphate transferase
MMNILKIFLPAMLSFLIGIAITPIATRYFYQYKLWKRTSRLDNPDEMSLAFKKIHSEKEKTETGTPRVGGIIIWGSVVLTIILVYVLKLFFGGELLGKLDFLSRNQTLLPLIALLTVMIGGLELNAIKGKVGPLATVKGVIHIGFVFGIAVALAISFLA